MIQCRRCLICIGRDPMYSKERADYVIRFIECLKHGDDSVSYTHLDVYKRQSVRSTERRGSVGTGKAGAGCGGKVFVRKLQENIIEWKCDNLLRDVSLAQSEGGIMMYLWFVSGEDREWGRCV